MRYIYSLPLDVGIPQLTGQCKPPDLRESATPDLCTRPGCVAADPIVRKLPYESLDFNVAERVPVLCPKEAPQEHVERLS